MTIFFRGVKHVYIVPGQNQSRKPLDLKMILFSFLISCTTNALIDMVEILFLRE